MIYHYPELFHCGNRFEKGDLQWINSKLERLNEHNQKVASDQYREIYLKQGRKQANEFLHSFVEEYGISKKDYDQISTSSGAQGKIQAKIEQLKSMQKKAKPTILGMLKK
ncbi:hypothetical protein PVP_XSN000062 [Vibrio phage PVP-XSN]|uniref:Uncharacterized protein n=1 Tax=Vibrio phage PVP-XSN TaxID=3056214 RepID=A0AAX3Y400_9CAUD|nr:hypothetical protein PVP_XSN000027 [Vibrio phage PVP-XSN]